MVCWRVGIVSLDIWFEHFSEKRKKMEIVLNIVNRCAAEGYGYFVSEIRHFFLQKVSLF